MTEIWNGPRLAMELEEWSDDLSASEDLTIRALLLIATQLDTILQLLANREGGDR